mgnify:CR=1 FL=1
MCTAISYKNGAAYFGRNLDLEYGYDERVVITPRNFIFEFRHKEPIFSHHAMIGMATVVDGFPLYYEATNEKGLSAAGLNFPENAVYYDFDNKKDNIAPFEFIPWILGKCASVDEAVQAAVEGFYEAVLLFRQLNRFYRTAYCTFYFLFGRVFGKTELCREFQHIVKREIVINNVRLRNITYKLFQRVEVFVKVKTVYVDITLCRLENACNNLEHCTLTRTVLTHKSYLLFRIHQKRHLFKQRRPRKIYR